MNYFNQIKGGIKPSKMSLRTKLTLSIILYGTLITGVLSVLLFLSNRSQMRSDFRQRLLDIVSIGAISLNANSLDDLKLKEQEGNAEYRSVKAALKRIKAQAADIHFAYTMRMTEKGQIMFVVDESDNPDETAHLGDIYSDASSFLQHNFDSMKTPLVEEVFYTD